MKVLVSFECLVVMLGDTVSRSAFIKVFEKEGVHQCGIPVLIYSRDSVRN